MPINFGVVGTGWITDSWITAAHKTGQWKLAAVYSRSQQTASAFAKKHQCSTTHTSLDVLAADKSVQAVYIASPNSLHYAHAKQMLQAKKHVILEKPATSTLAELDELFALARENVVFLIEAFRHIQEANYKLLREAVVAQKRLGQIYGASFTYASYSSRYNAVLAGEEPNIFSLAYSGGSLVDIGVYPIAFAVALFGAPKAQSYAPFICRTGVDGGGVVLLQYEGFGVQINNSKCYTSNAPCEIYGEKGTITVNGTNDIKSVSHWDPKTKQSEELAGPKRSVEAPNVNMEEEAETFYKIIEGGDDDEAKRLEEVSRIIVAITSDLRRQNGIYYPVDKQ